MIEILAIEDEKKLREMLEDSVKTYNISKKLDTENKVNIKCLEDDSQLGDLLFRNKYDCLVLDINWGNNNPNGGRELIRQILENKRIPVVVYSGRLNQIEDIEERFGFQKFDRTVKFSRVLDYIVSVKQTKIFDLLGYDGELDKIITDIFWKDIDKSLKSINLEEELDSKALARVLTTRIINYLSVSNEDDKYKYYEFYINPSLTKDCHNGDIYKLDDEYFLVITPECQLIKINTVNLIKIDFSEKIEEKVLESPKTEKRMSALRRLITEGDCSEHYIPPFNDLRHALVNFRNISTLEKSKLTEDKKIITVNPIYMKNIQSRFSQYYSRQGQPDINVDHLYNFIYNKKNSKHN